MDPYWKGTLGSAHPPQGVEVHAVIQRTRDAFTSFNWLTPLPDIADDTQEHIQRQFEVVKAKAKWPAGSDCLLLRRCAPLDLPHNLAAVPSTGDDSLCVFLSL